MNIDLTQIPSPCFLIDENLLIKNLKLLKEVSQKADIEIILALKGFATWGVFDIIKKYHPRAAASSVNEARLAFEELGTKAHAYAPAYSEDDINELIKYCSHITFNSVNQLNRFQNYCHGISLGLRVNPGYSPVSTALYNPCSPGSRLGVDIETVIENLSDGVEGLHIHSLCESDSYELDKTLQIVVERLGKVLPKLKWLNLGGGHLMTRKDYEINHLVTTIQKFKEVFKGKIILEPGSAFAWETGYLVSTILDIVENKGITTAILDVSFAAHMPDCLEMPYQPTIIGAQKGDTGNNVYRMGGNTCLSGDYYGNWSFAQPLKIGDKVVFNDMIHYTMVKTTMFNGVNHPSIGLWTKDGSFRLIRKFGYSDYKSRLS